MSKVVYTIVVDDPRGFVDSIWQHFEVFANSRDLLLGRLVAVAEMTAVRQVQRQNTVVWVEQSCVYR